MAGKKVNRKLILFDLQVSQALQDQETTRVEIEPHSEPQTDEGVTEQEVCAQEISSATTLQITITSTKEKTQDIQADEKLETVIPDKETVDAGTNNPVINTEVKIQQQQPLFKTFMMSELPNTPHHRNTRIIRDVSPFSLNKCRKQTSTLISKIKKQRNQRKLENTQNFKQQHLKR